MIFIHLINRWYKDQMSWILKRTCLDYGFSSIEEPKENCELWKKNLFLLIGMILFNMVKFQNYVYVALDFIITFENLTLNSLPSNKILGSSKLKAFADYKIKVIENLEFVLRRVENIVGKRKKWLPAFSPFPTMFSIGFFLRGVKSRDCVVMG